MTLRSVHPVGASTIFFKPYPLAVAVEGVAAAGFGLIELSAVKGSIEHLDPDDLSVPTLKDVERQLHRHALEVCSIAGHGELHTEVGLARHRRLLRAASALHAGVLVTFVDLVTPDGWPGFVDNLRALADDAAEAEVVVCLENHGRDMPTGVTGAAFLEKVDHPNVRLNYDTGNASFLAGVDPADDVRGVLPLVGHVHVKDQKGGPGSLIFPSLGEGDIDLESFARALRPGFTGTVVLEIAYPSPSAYPEPRVCSAVAARCREVWQTVESAAV